MVLEIIDNKSMVDEKTGCYVEARTFRDGVLVARTFSPRNYLKRNGSEGNAWLPTISIYQPTTTAIVKVAGDAIYSNKSVRTHRLSLTPTSGEKADASERSNEIFVFTNAFVTGEDVADLAVLEYFKPPTVSDIEEDAKHELGKVVTEITKKGSHTYRYGDDAYSGIHYRDVTIHGPLSSLDELLGLTFTGLLRHSYDLTYTEHGASSDKLYFITLDTKEVKELVKNVAARIKAT